MTENETRKELRYIKRRCDNEGRYKDCDALEKAIQALKEIQQYRAIGTVEELKELKEIRGNCKDCAGCTVWRCDCANERAYAIDEFVEQLKGNLVRKYGNANLTQQYVALQVTDWCNEIAEQMKAGR